MEQTQKTLLVVGGPTASGKTGLAIRLAQHFSTVILSADSRQFYHEMTIGNARPEPEELEAVQHYFIADRSVERPLSAGEFAKEALSLLDRLFQVHDYVVLVGGSGLFVRALTEGLDEFPSITPQVRQRVDTMFEEGGVAALQNALQSLDPSYFANVDQQNPARLRRALEVCYQTGQPFSQFRVAQAEARSFQSIYLQPQWPRELLYDRINKRVERMIEAGLEAEAKGLYDYRDLAALQTVGYQEWWPYFAGEQSLERTVELIQQNSRRYAKRQLTWNRRDGYWKHLPQADLRAALTYIHLVMLQQLVLQSFSVQPDASPILHKKEKRKRVALTHTSTEAILGVADLAFWKDLIILQYWADEELPTVGFAVLMHEACCRAEAETVYTKVRSDEEVQNLHSLGWQLVEEKVMLVEGSAPAKLMEWRRSEQAF